MTIENALTTLLSRYLSGHHTQGRDTIATEGPVPIREGELFPGLAGRSEEVPGPDSLERIAMEVEACDACRLRARRLKPVPGMGPAAPLVIAIGEGPGEEEDKRGLPFVGPAGQLLDKMLASIGLSRETNCYIANIVKCRPPGNRNPERDEAESCSRFLKRQIALLKPRFILALGRVASQNLLGEHAKGIGALRGQILEYENIPLICTYHPSALLRDDSLKRPAWEDLKLLKTLIDHA